MQTSMEETRESGYAGQQFSLIVERYGIVFVLIPLIALFGILNPVFLSVANILNVLRQISIFGIMAVGMTMVIMCAQIDLSVGGRFCHGCQGRLSSASLLGRWLRGGLDVRAYQWFPDYHF